MGESIEKHLKRKKEMLGEERREEVGLADIFKRNKKGQ